MLGTIVYVHNIELDNIAVHNFTQETPVVPKADYLTANYDPAGGLYDTLYCYNIHPLQQQLAISHVHTHTHRAKATSSQPATTVDRHRL